MPKAARNTQSAITYGKVDAAGNNPGTFSFTLGQGFNADGQLASHTYPDGSTGTYSYDKGQLSKVTLPDKSSITYGSYQWQVPTSIAGPGATKTLTLDALQRPLSIEVKNKQAQTLVSRAYQYDAAGDITQINSDLGKTEYGYDQLSRLTKATPDQNLQALGLPAEQYSYDAVHNRTSSQHQTGAWSYNKDNQLTQYPKLTPFKAGETAIETSVTYTLQGHTAKETSAQGEKNYSYNAAERLTSYSSTLAGQANTETEALYRYDPFGRRIGKVVTKPGAAADITYYLYSDIGLLAEIDNQGALRRAYAFKPHKTQTLWSTDPIWQADLNVGPTPSLATGATFHYLQTDHLGTPVISVTKAGALSWKALSEAFGATGVLQGQSSTTMNLRFPGQYFDKEMGSHYNYRRDYKPSFARYLESDPKGLNGGVNLYVYAKNAPHNFIDPEGGIPIPTKRVPKDEPVGNGCGDASSDKYIPDAFIGYDFSIPCRKHDICYGTCGNPKAMCDSKFLNDLLWQCFRPRPEIVMAIANPSLIGDCLFVAASYYQAVLIFGLKPYCAAQKKACPDCQPIPGCDQ